MRLISYDGIELKVSENTLKQLLRQFDVSKASLNQFGYAAIPVKSICANRVRKCIRCPLRDPHKKVNSCIYLIRRIIGEDVFPYVHMYDFGVWWDPKFDLDVRQALHKVVDVFSRATKI